MENFYFFGLFVLTSQVIESPHGGARVQQVHSCKAEYITSSHMQATLTSHQHCRFCSTACKLVSDSYRRLFFSQIVLKDDDDRGWGYILYL